MTDVCTPWLTRNGVHGGRSRTPGSQAGPHLELGTKSGEGWPRNEGRPQEEPPGRGEEGDLRVRQRQAFRPSLPCAQAQLQCCAVGDGAGRAGLSGQGGEEEVVRAGLSTIHCALDKIGQRQGQAIQRDRLRQTQASTGLQGAAQERGKDEPFSVFMVWSRARGF